VSDACERVYVGKRGGRASSAKQAEINKLLVDACKQVRAREGVCAWVGESLCAFALKTDRQAQILSEG
jgi:siroheme synthase